MKKVTQVFRRPRAVRRSLTIRRNRHIHTDESHGQHDKHDSTDHGLMFVHSAWSRKLARATYENSVSQRGPCDLPLRRSSLPVVGEVSASSRFEAIRALGARIAFGLDVRRRVSPRSVPRRDPRADGSAHPAHDLLALRGELALGFVRALLRLPEGDRARAAILLIDERD